MEPPCSPEGTGMLQHCPGGCHVAALPCCTGQLRRNTWQLSTAFAVLLLMLLMGCQMSEAALVVAVLHCLWWQQEALAVSAAGRTMLSWQV